MRKIFLFSLLLYSFHGFTQVSPPGLTNKGGASWYALGINQELNKKGNRISGYVGLGRAGTSQQNNPFQDHVLFVVNTAYKKNFKTNFHIGPSLSYRHQEIYESNMINEKQELRIGLEIGKRWAFNRLQLRSQFKQEYRKFYDASFRNWNESIQFRSRIKLSLNYQLAKNKKHHISTHIETLFSTTEHLNPSVYWDKFNYSDSRLSFFYSYSIPKPKLKMSVGYMLNLIGKNNVNCANYISMDLIWTNPFSKN